MKKSILILCLFSCLSFLTQLNLFPQSPLKAKKVVIFAEKGWQNSGIALKKGQYYSVSAWGSWSSGYETLAFGPEGKGYGTINDLPLVGWITGKQPPKLGYDSFKREIITMIIFLGKGGLYKSYANGSLWLSMGEWSGCEECSGEMEVLITVYE